MAEAFGADLVHARLEWGHLEPDDLRFGPRRCRRREGASTSPTRRPRPESSATCRRWRPSRRKPGRWSSSTRSRASAPFRSRRTLWDIDVVVSGSQKALDVPAGPRVRSGLGRRARRIRERDRAALRTWTGSARARRRRSSTRRSRRRSRSSAPSTSRSACCWTKGSKRRSIATSRARARVPRRGRQGDGPRALLPGRGRSARRDRDPRAGRHRLDAGSSRACVTASAITIANGQGAPEGKDLPHRPHRLVRHLRHHHRARGGRARPHGARRARSSAASQSPLRSKPGPSTRPFEPRSSSAKRSRTRAFAAAASAASRSTSTATPTLDETIGALRRDHRPLGDEGDGGPDRARGQPEGDRPRRSRHRQRRRRGGDARAESSWRTRRSRRSSPAAEHTIGLLVALTRNIPQAHAALKQGRWEREAYGGVELADKTLGVLGFGRIGQQVARRAAGLGMRRRRVRPVRLAGPLPRARCRARRRPTETSTRPPTS